jgi:tetratricopeptide (TPR) repeat protein
MELDGLIANIRDTYLSDSRIAFFVAAGVSKDCPTHLPLGRELARAVRSGFLDSEMDRDLSRLEELLEERSLEEVCGIIEHELEDKEQLIIRMASALDADELKANCNHRFLARVLGDGHLVVTTNWDSMVERAYLQLYGRGFPTERICYDGPTFGRFLEQSSASVSRRVGLNEVGWLLKLHGTFRVGCCETRHSVMTTLDRVGKGLPPKAEDALIGVLHSCPLVVLGYGCMDIDIVYRVLDDIESAQPAWWVKHNDQMKRIDDYDQLQKTLRQETSKSTKDSDVKTLNIARVLCKRGMLNGGRVWQITAPTSQVAAAINTQTGGITKLTGKPCSCKAEPWRGDLRQLGVEASDSERLHVLAKFAQACGPSKSGGRDVYDLSNTLFEAALNAVGSDCNRSRIYREVGWNSYRIDPERNSDEAVRFYDSAERLLPQDRSSWTSRVIIQSLKALAYRRARQMDEAWQTAEEASRSLPRFIRSGDLPSESGALCSYLKDAGVEEDSFGLLGSALRRLAGVFDQCVAGPLTLATGIRCKYEWKTEEREVDTLIRARKLLEADRALQRITGEPIQEIQSEHHLGLVYSKLGEGEAAVGIHERSCRTARHFGRWYEYAQALRNRALAEEVVGRLDDAISNLKKAVDLFEGLEGRVDDVLVALWHLGRMRIKNNDETGLDDIERHRNHPRTVRSWHWTANDCALLGIGCFDIGGDLTAARQHFTSMVEEYGKDGVDLRKQTYGVDNALANAIAAAERLSKDKGAESLDVRTELVQLRHRLERLRSHQLQRLSIQLRQSNDSDG